MIRGDPCEHILEQQVGQVDNLAVLKSRCVAAVLINSIDQQQIEETSDEIIVSFNVKASLTCF